MQEASRIDCDVLIVGGGLVGSLLANALSGLPLDVVLVEAEIDFLGDLTSLPVPEGRTWCIDNLSFTGVIGG